jgi:hydroxyacylglutathione hydrolase
MLAVATAFVPMPKGMVTQGEADGAEEVSGHDLLAQFEAGTAPTILDVRSRNEFRRGHVPGAVNVPFWMLWRLGSIGSSREAPVVVYCGHGPRAWLAGGVLRTHRFTNVKYLAGHFSRWRGAGLREER